MYNRYCNDVAAQSIIFVLPVCVPDNVFTSVSMYRDVDGGGLRDERHKMRLTLGICCVYAECCR